VTLANDPAHLGARIGFISILHTWGQNLMHHPHVHCIVTGGGLSPEGDRWVPSSKNFFIHVEALSKLFKYKVLDYLKICFETGALIFPGGISHLVEPRAFERLRSAFYYKSGLSIASRLSAVTKESFNTWADILTGSPSAITSSWRFRMARSHFAGVITPMVISKRS
jgi:hypothetical protein